MKTVIACDSFKGSLASAEVCRSLEKGIKSVLPDAQTALFPLADGGEGTVECFYNIRGGRLIDAKTVNCFFEPINAAYLMLDGKTAVIETAAASGIADIPKSRLNPMLTSTYGTGLLIKDAIENGATEIILGLGGSATNDGGTGVLNALGIDFLDGNGKALSPVGENLNKIKSFSQRKEFSKLREIKFTLACDVGNVFCGKTGAAYVFAAQKGADDKMIEALDKGLYNLADVIFAKLGADLKLTEGAGAAGGLSGGMLAFLNCEIKSGFSVLADACELESAIADADLVITGEGKTDFQTAYGKLPFRVCELANKHKKKCILVCGQLDSSADTEQMGFNKALTLVSDTVSPDEAIKNAAAYLTEKGKQIAQTFI